MILSTVIPSNFFEVNLGQVILAAIFLVGWGMTWQKSKLRGETNAKAIEVLNTDLRKINEVGTLGTANHFSLLTNSIAGIERRVTTLEGIAPSLAKMETNLDWMLWMMRKRWGEDGVPK